MLHLSSIDHHHLIFKHRSCQVTFNAVTPQHYQDPAVSSYLGAAKKRRQKSTKWQGFERKKLSTTHYYNQKINSSKPCYHVCFWSYSTGVPDSISFFMGHKAETHLDGLGNIHQNQQTVALVKSKKKLLLKEQIANCITMCIYAYNNI